jgi:hypothetical protein
MKESTMRPTILTSVSGLLALSMTACLADVGGGECVGQRCKEEMPDAGTTTAVTCENPKELTTELTLRTAADFDSLPKTCWTLNAKLRVEGQAITSLQKLGDLIEVNDLELVDTALTQLDTKKQIKVYGSLLVSGNTKLTTLNNIAVKKWEGQTQGGAFVVTYNVRNNAQLASLDGLRYITTVDNDLRITDNAKLTSVELTELGRVGGALVISSTGATQVNLSALTQVGRVEIATNPALTSVRGFGAATIGGDFILRGNPQLASLGTMSSLTTILGSLTIDDNDALTDITGLTETMQRVAGTLTISGNANLTTLGSLSHAQQINSASITNNPKLGYCRAVEVDHCVPNSTVTITGNLTQNNCACWCGL